MFSYLKILRFNHLFKNLLILTPVLTYGGFDFKSNIVLFMQAFITLSCVNLFCYLINDFTDQEIDRSNKLKKKINISKKEFLILGLALSILIIFFTFYYKLFYNIFLYIYLINFFIYNFFAKKIKFLDVLILNNFYIIRILYGAKIFNIDLTLGFILFFTSLFMGLSFSKRVTQIQINKLKKENKILKYSLDDLRNLFKFILLFFSISIITLFLYLINNYNPFITSLNFFKISNHPIDFLIILFIVFSIWIMRSILLLKKSLIEVDFYKFFIKDKYSYFSLLILIIYLLIRNAY